MSSSVIVEVPKEFTFHRSRIIKAYQGPISRSFQTYKASTNNSINSIQFAITTPSRRVLIRKNIMVYYNIQVALTGIPILLTTKGTYASGGTPYYSIINPGQGDAPRFMPVSQNIISFTGSLGDVQVTVPNTNQFIDVLSRYSLSPEERTKLWSSFPSLSDPLGAGLSTNNGNYSTFTVSGLLPAQQAGLYGSFNNMLWASDISNVTQGTSSTVATGQSFCLPLLKNPLTSGFQGCDKRGDYYYYVNPQNFTANTSNTQYAQFVSCEPLLGLSGFGQTCLSREAGFTNIQSMSFNISMANTLNMWSHDISVGGTNNGSTAALSAATTFVDTPTMIIEYWTPEEKLQIYQNPYYYPYSAITYFTQPVVTSIPSSSSNIGNSQFTVNFQNVQVTSVPQEMYIFCRVATNTTQYLNTSSTLATYSVASGSICAMDNYAGCPSGQNIVNSSTSTSSTNAPIVKPVTNILSITFDNSPVQLQGMNAQQIYNMCLENGLQGVSFSDFQDFGGIYKVIFGKDIYSVNTNEVVLGGTMGSYNIQVTATFQNNFSQTLNFQPVLVTIQQGYIKIGPDGNELILNTLNNQNLSNATAMVDKSPIQDVSTTNKQGGLLGTQGGFIGPLLSLGLEGKKALDDLLYTVGKPIARGLSGSGMGGKRLSKKHLKRMRNGGYSLH